MDPKETKLIAIAFHPPNPYGGGVVAYKLAGSTLSDLGSSPDNGHCAITMPSGR